MKHLLSLAALLLCVICLLCACADPPEQGEQPDADAAAVVDISFTEGKDYADTIEPFWLEGQTLYYFGAEMSHDCTVTYADGSTENLLDALEGGRVMITDLDRFGVHCGKLKAEPIAIVVGSPIPPGTAVEIFYSDGLDTFSFPYDNMSSVVTVYYDYGMTENLKDAIAGGRVTGEHIAEYLSDHCWNEPRYPAVVGISFSEGVDYPAAIEYFWSDGVYHYVFPSIMSGDCTVTYENGASENLVYALEVGRVTVADMDRFDLPYWREPVAAAVVDIRFEGDPDGPLPDVIECVTEDENYWYFMGGEAHAYVVEYTTGAVEPLLQALRDWRARPADLDRFDVPYWTEPIGEQ